MRTLRIIVYIHGKTEDIYNLKPGREGEVDITIHSLLKPGDVFVDIGANVGYYTLVVAMRGCRVVSVEPVPSTVAVHWVNIRLNNLRYVKLVPYCAWHEDSTIYIQIPHRRYYGLASAFYGRETMAVKIPVKCIRLDKILNKYSEIRLVKINVEGAEYEVLKGLEKVLPKTKFIIVELSKNVQILNLLSEKGFKIKKLHLLHISRLTVIFFNSPKRSAMRVVVVSASAPKTPSEILLSFVYDEVTRLAKHGIEAHVARNEVGSSSIFNGVYFYDLPRRIDPTVLTQLPQLAKYPLPSLIRGPRGLLILYGELRYANQIRKVLQTTKPDILHAHFAHPEGWAAYLAKTSSSHKPPLVVTLHGYDINTEPTCNYGIRLYRQYDALVKKVLNNADAIIAPSTAIYREAQKIAKNPDRVHLIHNGVDTAKFHPSLDGKIIRDQYDLHGKFVVFTARHHRCVYGLEYLIRSAPIVLKKRNDVVYIIGGDGPLRPHLTNLAKALGVEKHIIFTGYISRDQLPHYYAASDVVVAPSLQEGWGLVITEAMATGKPVIGTKVGGIPDQIIDGYNGFLVPPRDPEAIAQKILHLSENPEKTKEMGKKARQLAEEKFDIEIRVKKIVTLYKELSH